MTFEQIRLIVESRMAAWTDAPVAFDGAPAGPDVLGAQENKTPWVRLSIVDGDSFTAGLGSSPCVRRTGIIFVQVFTNRDIGSRPARLIADSLAAHIQYYRQGGLESLAATVTRIGPSDGYYQINVSVPFRAD